MPHTNSWLCKYAIGQIGRPYWYATSGQISSVDLYQNVTRPAILSDLGAASLYSDYMDQLGVKVHDCSGLVVGALTCEGINEEPSGSSPVAHGSTSQYTYDCSTKGSSMNTFPNIPGTLVFHSNGEYKSHVGIYVGTYTDLSGTKHTDEVVEAMSHAYGVTTTKLSNSKWDSWGQLTCCTVDTNENTTFDARLLGSTIGPVKLNVEKMTPFVARTEPSFHQKLDYKKLKAERVSAMAFYGGELFDINHMKRTYVNPYLAGLVKQCNDAGMPYLLYVNIRAKTEIEADLECRALYYVLAQFPPKLGVWFSIQTTVSKEMNDKILDVYYKYMVRWGLTDRCGIYATSKQLEKISWVKYQDKFYLWMIDPMDVTKVDDELLQPEMFEVPD